MRSTAHAPVFSDVSQTLLLARSCSLVGGNKGDIDEHLHGCFVVGCVGEILLRFKQCLELCARSDKFLLVEWNHHQALVKDLHLRRDETGNEW